VSLKEQMLKARSLIQAKRYDEARDILQGINHPKAKEWLAKIGGKTSAVSKPQKPSPKTQAKAANKAAAGKSAKKGSQPSRVFVILAVILIVGLLTGVALLAFAIISG